MEWSRSAGVLLHPTCLPGPGGIGDLGPAAHAYLDWLREAKASWWQVLPLHPTGPGDSPYSALSTFAGNPLLISLDALLEEGLVERSELHRPAPQDARRVDFAVVAGQQKTVLAGIWERVRRHPPRPLARALDVFREQNRFWLPDWTLYAALKERHGGVAWTDWPRPLTVREPEALAAARTELADEIGYHELVQFLFFTQWERVRAAATEKGIRILGDVPIFVALDSADVWARPDLFQLDAERRPVVVAGVPPDYFSATGQRWGNPIYDWERHRAEGWAWWVERMRHALTLADAVRIDHFRGFAACWEVPAADEVAAHGSWRPGPGRELFDALAAALGDLPLLAEDLGEITPDVVALRKELGLPGMAILHFGFQPEPRSSFIPYHHERDLVVYTGTHDNNTTAGWFAEDASAAERALFLRYAGSGGVEVHWDMIRLALASVANVAIVPHQDLVGLGIDGRMNLPGQGSGNWVFRLSPDMLGAGIARRFADLVETYGRARGLQARP